MQARVLAKTVQHELLRVPGVRDDGQRRKGAVSWIRKGARGLWQRIGLPRERVEGGERPIGEEGGEGDPLGVVEPPTRRAFLGWTAALAAAPIVLGAGRLVAPDRETRVITEPDTDWDRILKECYTDEHVKNLTFAKMPEYVIMHPRQYDALRLEFEDASSALQLVKP